MGQGASPWLALHRIQRLSSSHCVFLLLFYPWLLFQWSPPTPTPMGSQAQRAGQFAQVLLQASVEMLNVPAHPPLPGRGPTQEVLHLILSKPHWKQRLSQASVPEASGPADKLPVHGASAGTRTGTARGKCSCGGQCDCTPSSHELCISSHVKYESKHIYASFFTSSHFTGHSMMFFSPSLC